MRFLLLQTFWYAVNSFKRCLAMLGAVIIALAVVLALPGIATSTVFAAILIALKVMADFRLHCAERATLHRTHH